MIFSFVNQNHRIYLFILESKLYLLSVKCHGHWQNKGARRKYTDLIEYEHANTEIHQKMKKKKIIRIKCTVNCRMFVECFRYAPNFAQYKTGGYDVPS